jgi:hypothetical protein
MSKVKWVFYTQILFIFIISCSSDDANSKENQMMGKFDSLVIAQSKGPSIEAIYENKVVHVKFPSLDSLLISADIYENNDSTLHFLFCHQAGYSKGEFINSAILLSQLGYCGMAVDLRSGGSVNNIPNETNLLAQSKGLSTEYIDSRQDIEASINYLYECNGGQPIVLVGSSYSASLCLLIAKNNSKIKAVIAFSPGEYLENINVTEELEGFDKPVFVTSSKMEIQQTSKIVKNISSELVNHFKPTFEGIHGASALWKTTIGYKEYWNAVFEFLAFLNQPKLLDEAIEMESTIEKDSSKNS